MSTNRKILNMVVRELKDVGFGAIKYARRRGSDESIYVYSIQYGNVYRELQQDDSTGRVYLYTTDVTDNRGDVCGEWSGYKYGGNLKIKQVRKLDLVSMVFQKRSKL